MNLMAKPERTTYSCTTCWLKVESKLMRTDRGAFKTAAITLGVVIGLLVVIFVIKFFWGMLLFSNEMACSEGEAPATDIHGGSTCFKEGTELPKGFTWDVRGNYRIN